MLTDIETIIRKNYNVKNISCCKLSIKKRKNIYLLNAGKIDGTKCFVMDKIGLEKRKLVIPDGYKILFCYLFKNWTFEVSYSVDDVPLYTVTLLQIDGNGKLVEEGTKLSITDRKPSTSLNRALRILYPEEKLYRANGRLSLGVFYPEIQNVLVKYFSVHSEKVTGPGAAAVFAEIVESSKEVLESTQYHELPCLTDGTPVPKTVTPMAASNLVGIQGEKKRRFDTSKAAAAKRLKRVLPAPAPVPLPGDTVTYATMPQMLTYNPHMQMFNQQMQMFNPQMQMFNPQMQPPMQPPMQSRPAPNLFTAPATQFPYAPLRTPNMPTANMMFSNYLKQQQNIMQGNPTTVQVTEPIAPASVAAANDNTAKPNTTS